MKRYSMVLLIVLATADTAGAGIVVADDHLAAVVDVGLEISVGQLLANDLLPDTLDQVEIVRPPAWGHLVEETVEGKPFFRYEVSMQEILPSATGIDFFTYRVTSGPAVSDEAFVFVKVYPDRTPLAGRWPTAHPSLETGSGLGWFDALSATFRLCSIFFYPNGDGYLDECEVFEAPVKVPGGGEALVGDWDGDGDDDLGTYDPWTATFILYTFNAGCVDPPSQDCDKLAEHARFSWGAGGSLPVAGDWSGQGHDVVGLYDPVDKGFWLLHSNAAGADADWVPFQPVGRPLAGQWSLGAGGLADSVGVFDRVSQTAYYRSGAAVVTQPIADVPELGTPFSFEWNDHSWLGIRDPENRVLLLLGHPDSGRMVRRVSVPKDP